MTREPVLSNDELNRATLARQLLLGRERLNVTRAIERLGALQAQEPAAPFVALWSRIEGFERIQLAQAIARRSVVRTTLMRGTLHLVSASDWAHFQPAMRAAWARRGGTMPPDQFIPLEQLVLAYAAEPRSGADLERYARALGAHTGPGRWWQTRGSMPLIHAGGAGPWCFGVGNAIVAAPPALRRRLVDAEVGARRLVLRHLAAFGPATVADVTRWTMLGAPTVRLAAEQLGSRLRSLRAADGRALLDVRGAPLPDGRVPAPPRLLTMWDSVILAFDDRRRLLHEEHRASVINKQGDLRPTFLVDGRVAGMWRMEAGRIELLPFAPLPPRVRRGLEAEAKRLEAWAVPHDGKVFSRYTRGLGSMHPLQTEGLG